MRALVSTLASAIIVLWKSSAVLLNSAIPRPRDFANSAVNQIRSDHGAIIIRARLIISGRVQRVGYRASARDMAQAQRLSGWVRNRYDGDVEIVVEGEEGAVHTFMTWCHAGPPGARVTTVQVTMEPYTGEFQGFRVVE